MKSDRMKLLDRAYKLATTPGMAPKWVRWNLGTLGLTPSVELPAGGRIFGFRDFSEYWTAPTILPTNEEVAAIERYAGRTGVILDVGANVGTFALTLARLRPACTVHAFEPSPGTRANLEDNLARNRQQNVKPQPFAVGCAAGEAHFLEHPTSRRMGRLAAGGDSLSTTYAVKITTVDGFLDSIGNPDVAFLKIDVEGFEADVLRGAESTLRQRRCRAGLIELCLENLTQAGSSVEDLMEALQSVGWRMRELKADGTAGRPFVAAEVKAGELTNCMILPVDAS